MTIRSLIHAVDPYRNIQKEALPFIDHGWGGNEPIFAKLINQVKPKRILELGSWYGQSAITMGRACEDLAIDCEIVCVDTWLGSAEHWIVPEYRAMLHTKDGRPEFYHQFLANVMHAGLQHMITPFPATVASACSVLNYSILNSGVRDALRSPKFDLIYVDAGHSQREVTDCLEWSTPLLSDDGVMFGHDIGWHEVEFAVIHHFGSEYRIEGDFWIAKEPT